MGSRLAATAAAAALLLAMGGCAAQAPVDQAPWSRFERVRDVPPSTVLFGPYSWQYAQRYSGAAQRYYPPGSDAVTAQGRAVQGAAAQTGATGSGTPHQAPPVPVSPFSDNPVSFLIHGEFARGEHVIVRVCLRADRSIASSSIVESSGDPRFDELAISWAQRVRLRQQGPADSSPVAPCGAVRVELHDASEPAVIAGHDDELG